MSSEAVLTLVDYSDLFSVGLKKQVDEAKEQELSFEWLAKSSQGAAEFIALTTGAVDERLKYLEVIQLGLVESFKAGKLIKAKLTEGTRRTSNAIAFTGTELMVLERRRKFVTEDIWDQYLADRSVLTCNSVLWQSCTLTSAYLKVRDRIFMTDFLLLEGNWDKKALSKKFRDDLLVYYSASKVSLLNRTVHHCHLSGKWCPPSVVKAVYIVPKLLESEALSYLFGVEEANLSDPRNGRLLYSILASPPSLIKLCTSTSFLKVHFIRSASNLEEPANTSAEGIILSKDIADGFESGLIVFVPFATDEAGGIVWRCLLTDQRQHIGESKVWPELFWQVCHSCYATADIFNASAVPFDSSPYETN
jgi:hypothetical protein